MRRRHLIAAGTTAAVALSFTGGMALSSSLTPNPKEVAYNIPTLGDGSVNPDPFLASGVATGKDVPVYTAAGTGPAARNTLAPAGSPERYIDYDVIALVAPDFAPSDADKAAGALPAGMTVTEAQGLNAMARVQENLQSAGLGVENVTFMRIFQDNPPGTDRADYNGWNRAYRKFMANVSRTTGEVLPAYAPVVVENETRPARSNIEVGTLPVVGWLIEIEVVAAYTR